MRQGIALVAAVAATAAPVSLRRAGHELTLEPSHAAAKGGGGKGGGGNGGGGGGNGNGNGNGQGKGAGKPSKPSAPSAPTAPASVPDVTVRHRNGMRETIRGGRYEMRDSRNRPVIERPATELDYRRVRGG